MLFWKGAKIFEIQKLRDYKGQNKQGGNSSAHTLAACECLRRLGARQAGAVRRAPPNYPEIIPIIQRCPWGCCAWRNYPSAQIISPANQAGRGRPKPFLRYFSPFYYFLLQSNCLVFHCTNAPWPLLIIKLRPLSLNVLESRSLRVWGSQNIKVSEPRILS